MFTCPTYIFGYPYPLHLNRVWREGNSFYFFPCPWKMAHPTHPNIFRGEKRVACNIPQTVRVLLTKTNFQLPNSWWFCFHPRSVIWEIFMTKRCATLQLVHVCCLVLRAWETASLLVRGVISVRCGKPLPFICGVDLSFNTFGKPSLV